MSSPRFPEPPPAIPPTSEADLDKMLERLASRREAWGTTTIVERIGYLKKGLAGVVENAEGWVRDGCKRKGIAENDVLAGEEWLAGPMTTARNIRLFIEALEAGGQPVPPSIHERPDGQKVAKVFPAGFKDKLMFAGTTAEVWIEPGKSASQGAIYRDAAKRPVKVALVLGAGNVSSIPPMDFLYKLFVENEVCILKMNPVNADAGPHLEKAFKALIDDGFLAICYGGAPVGAYLSNHKLVETLHVTGSDRTYDAIVWGPDPAEQAKRKAEGKPVNTRPFTAELGCVTPVLVVPGPWSDDDLEFQARHVAGMVAQNASFNCNAAKVLVLPKRWEHRDNFVKRVHAALARTPARKAYYPGAQDRYHGFLDKYPQAQPVGEKRDGVVPWTVIPDVPAKKGEYALTNEAFCGVLAECDIDASDAADFLKKAVDFANDECWGTLSMCLLIDNDTAKKNADALDQAVAKLRYGGIGVNVWPGLIYALVVTTWGAFPGHPPTEIQSGAGVVHNSYLFDHPQKSVVRAPFRIKPTPVWFPDHRNLARVGKKLLEFEADAGMLKLFGVAAAALKG
jgi:acyl-CoA reductase-like NAD-dependent aldehyde dehydrogenase